MSTLRIELGHDRPGALVKIKRFCDAANRRQMGSAPLSALEIRDAATTQAGPLGQFLLGQPGRDAVAPQQHRKRR